MEQKTLAHWLKGVLIGIALILGLLIFWLLPVLGRNTVGHPVLSAHLWAWLLMIWVAAVPCVLVLWAAWRIVENIEGDRSFSLENAALLRRIAVLAAVDGVYFFLINAVYALIGFSEGWLFLASLFVDFVAVAVTVAGAALSHLVKKAALLQDESDLTI